MSTFHKTAKSDIQKIWIDFIKICDLPSSQFKDRLVVVTEKRTPFMPGITHSFQDYEAVCNSFFGIGETPETNEAKNKALWNLGPRLCHKILEMKSRGSLKILDDITTFTQLHNKCYIIKNF